MLETWSVIWAGIACMLHPAGLIYENTYFTPNPFKHMPLFKVTFFLKTRFIFLLIFHIDSCSLQGQIDENMIVLPWCN